MHHKISLPIGTLHIHDHFGGVDPHKIFMPPRYSKFIGSALDFDLHIGSQIDTNAENYREKVFQKGIYLGHHSGKPGNLKYSIDRMDVSIEDGDATEYLRLIWSYALKYILTIGAIAVGGVHVKGALIRSTGSKNILLVGRGGSGKSTLARALGKFGFEILGNTHVIIKGDHGWAVPSWVRERSGSTEKFVDLPALSGTNDGPIAAIVIVDHNKDGICHFIKHPPSDVEAYFRHFVSGLGTYDLKEDLYDSFKDFETSNSWLLAENREISRIISSLPIYYLTADAYHESAMHSAASEIISILR